MIFSRSSKNEMDPDSRKIMTRSATRALGAESTSAGASDVTTPAPNLLTEASAVAVARGRPSKRRRPELEQAESVGCIFSSLFTFLICKTTPWPRLDESDANNFTGALHFAFAENVVSNLPCDPSSKLVAAR